MVRKEDIDSLLSTDCTMLRKAGTRAPGSSFERTTTYPVFSGCWRKGKYMVGLGATVNPNRRASDATPTTSYSFLGPKPARLKCRPIALSNGQQRRAKLWLMMATGVLPL